MGQTKRALLMPGFFQPVCIAYKKSSSISKRERYVCVEEKYIKGDILRLLLKIQKTFGIKNKIPLPKVAVFTKSNEQRKLPYAAYDTEAHIVIVNLSIDMSKDEEFLFIHELCHHVVLMLKGGKGKGFVYLQEGYLFGRMIDEGFTNFLAEQVYGKSIEIAYIFPTHIARQISNILGKEYTNNLYLHSNCTTLRNDFNKKLKAYYPIEKYQLSNNKNCVIKMAPFDIFCSCVEYVGVHWGNSDSKIKKELITAIKCSMEMLDYYAILSDTTDIEKYTSEQKQFANRYKIN